MKKSLFFLLVLLFVHPAGAELSQEKRIRDATTLIDLFVHHYGPLPWKKEYLRIDVDQMANDLMTGVAEAQTDEEFYDAMILFVSGFQDAHVDFTIPSTYRVSLGFSVQDFGGEVLITDIDREVLPEETFPLQKGDALLAVDAIPVQTLIDQLIPYANLGSEIATRRLASSFLTRRSQKKFPHVPQGEATVRLRSFATGEMRTLVLPWLGRGNLLAEANERESLTAGKGVALESPPSDSAADVSSWGSLRPHFPLWKTFLERKRDPILTGVVTLEGKKVVYIRFHTWSFEEPKTLIALLEEEIAYLQETTEALIIDQTSNNGGDICLGQKVAGFFVEEEKPSVLFQIKPTRFWLMDYENSSEEMETTAAVIAEIRRSLEAGEELSRPISLCPEGGRVKPYTDREGNRILYTKPKLLLIDEFDCSTGDMFPAILQDAGVVTTLGSRTIGCGGNVFTMEYMGLSDFSLRITASLALRPKPATLPNGGETQYLENIGVTPDIPYPFTARDFHNNYRDYRKAVEEAVLDLL